MVVCNAPRATTNAAYASYAGSYWAGTATPGSTGDTDMANLNADIASVIAEFPAGTVIVADIDSVLAKTAALFASDGIHPNELGAQPAAQVVRDAILAAPAADVSWSADARDAGAIRQPRRSLCWDFPDGITGSPTSTTLAMTNLSLFAWDLTVTEAAERWDMVCCEVTTASTGGGGLVRFGLYDDEDWLDYPQCLVQDWGTIATTSTGIKTLAINWPPDAGAYWLVAKIDSVGVTVAGTLRAWTGAYSRRVPYSTAATPASLSAARNSCYTATGIATGAMPQAFPTSATPLVNTTGCPVVLLRHAAKV